MCLNQPFSLRSFVGDADGSRDVRVTLRLRSNFPSSIIAVNVKVRFSIPKSVSSISSKLSSDEQTAAVSNADRQFVWTLKRVPGKTECIAEFRVAVLCQFLDKIDYSTAFKALQEKNTYDAMDSYYFCVWEISILEYLVYLHTKHGEMDKRRSAMRALTQLDLNSNNPEDIIQRAVQIRKRKYLGAIEKQYV